LLHVCRDHLILIKPGASELLNEEIMTHEHQLPFAPPELMLSIQIIRFHFRGQVQVKIHLRPQLGRRITQVKTGLIRSSARSLLALLLLLLAGAGAADSQGEERPGDKISALTLQWMRSILGECTGGIGIAPEMALRVGTTAELQFCRLVGERSRSLAAAEAAGAILAEDRVGRSSLLHIPRKVMWGIQVPRWTGPGGRTPGVVRIPRVALAAAAPRRRRPIAEARAKRPELAADTCSLAACARSSFPRTTCFKRT
jgi:hypothetical protein